MPCNFSVMKSGGTIPMLSPHAEKWGCVPSSPTDRRPYVHTGTEKQTYLGKIYFLKTKVTDVIEQARRRKWTWAGHGRLLEG